MYTIVGLGNRGTKYERTRHNAGTVAVHALQEAFQFPSFVSSATYAADISEGVIGEHDVRLAIPHTFMNESGGAVRKVVSDPHELILAYDDIDLPIGTFRIAHGRGSGGHNGVRSVIDKIGSKDFTRIRIGIAPVSLFGVMRKPPKERIPDFVLREFSKKEMGKLEAILPDITDAVRLIVTKGREAAMNEYH